MKKHVFISYRSDDEKNAKWLKEHLEQSGIACWMSSYKINPSENYAKEIPSAIHSSFALVLLMSSAAQESPHIKREMQMAKETSIPIFFYIIEDCAIKKPFDLEKSEAERIEAFLDIGSTLDDLVLKLKAIISDNSNTFSMKEEIEEYYKVKRKHGLNRKKRQRDEEAEKRIEREKELNYKPSRNPLLKLTPFSSPRFADEKHRISLYILSVFFAVLTLALTFGTSATMFSEKGVLWFLSTLLVSYLIFIVFEVVAGLCSELLSYAKSVKLIAFLSIIIGITILPLYVAVFINIISWYGIR